MNMLRNQLNPHQINQDKHRITACYQALLGSLSLGLGPQLSYRIVYDDDPAASSPTSADESSDTADLRIDSGFGNGWRSSCTSDFYNNGRSEILPSKCISSNLFASHNPYIQLARIRYMQLGGISGSVW